MTDEEIRTALAEIVQEVSGVEASRVQMDAAFAADLDLDSLTMVEVVVAAEERFDVRIPDDDAGDLVTVADAVAYVQNVSA
ncbi:MAG TPA: acyl carrier protein [Mycobacteriales bacterium]